MSEIREAAEAARNLHRQFRAVVLVGEVLGQIADLDQRREEAQKLAQRAEGELSDLLSRLAGERERLAEVQRLTAEQAEEAVRLVAQAQSDADEIRGKAEEDVRKARAICEQAEAATRADMKREREAHDAVMAGLRDDEAELRAEIGRLNAALVELRQRLGVT